MSPCHSVCTRHVAHMYACVRMCARMRACVHMCARVLLLRLSTLFKIFSNSLISYFLYTHQFTWIFVMHDYLCLFLGACDIMKSGVCDHMNQIMIINLRLSEEVRGAL